MIEWVLVPAVLATSVAETVELFAFHKKVVNCRPIKRAACEREDANF